MFREGIKSADKSRKTRHNMIVGLGDRPRKEDSEMMIAAYKLVLADGRYLAVKADNRVDAFDKMRLLWPVLTEGYSWRDVIVF